MNHTKSPLLLTALGFSLFGLCGPARAQLIASDSYAIGSSLTSGQYPSGAALSSTALLGVSGTAGGLTTPGFTVGRYGAGTGTSQFSATSSGLSYAPLGAASGTSGKVSYAAAGLDNTNRSTARTLSPAAPVSSTYWTSLLVNRGATVGTGLNYVMAGFGGTTAPLTLAAAGGPGLFMGFSGDAGNLAMRYRDVGGTFTETILNPTTLANTTYAIVARIDVNTSGTSDSVTWWLNPTDFTSPATLTSTAQLTNSFTGNVLSANTDLVRLNYLSFNWNSSAFFDEARLGTTLASLGGQAGAAAPEPGTIALGTLGLAALLARRRRA
jgi:PEP-CTERM motif